MWGIDLKHKKISIKWKIFVYLIAFVALLLMILWLFQTVYLGVFYKIIKTNELNNAMENLQSVVGEEGLDDAVETISERYDICILVTDTNGNEIYSSHVTGECLIHKMNTFDLYEYYNEALTFGGDLKFTIKKTDFLNIYKDSEHENFGRFEDLPNMPSDDSSSVLLVSIQEDQNGDEIVLFLNSIITPVDATVKTLRIQLVYISVILVILSLMLALFISRRVSKSIIKVNESAKKLSKGDFEIRFSGHDYKEISELSDTLNYTASELGKTEKLQKELIANVSHDLRTPLTMITGYAEVIRDIPNESTPENLQVIIDEAKRLSLLVNDLLDISKLQSGVAELKIAKYDLTKSIKSVISRYSKLVNQDGYRLDFQYEENIFVEADEFKIYQVIYNFISNAINFTGSDKKVTIVQKVIGDKVRVEVIDTGEGIGEKEIASVWQRYYKSDKNHKRGIIGTGLGLSIVKNILELHESQYGVESEPGKGSCFWFELKLFKE